MSPRCRLLLRSSVPCVLWHRLSGKDAPPAGSRSRPRGGAAPAAVRRPGRGRQHLTRAAPRQQKKVEARLGRGTRRRQRGARRFACLPHATPTSTSPWHADAASACGLQTRSHALAQSRARLIQRVPVGRCKGSPRNQHAGLGMRSGAARCVPMPHALPRAWRTAAAR